MNNVQTLLEIERYIKDYRDSIKKIEDKNSYTAQLYTSTYMLRAPSEDDSKFEFEELTPEKLNNFANTALVQIKVLLENK